jgi:two-component sensor histidine kinase
MKSALNPSQKRLAARRQGRRMRRPELIVDFEAENVLLRAALALSEGDSERRKIVTQELKHRIGNLLTVVSAVARQTFNDATPQKLADFCARLHALAAAQKLLIDSERRAAPLDEIVRDALAAHYPSGGGANLSGPQLPLNGRRAHALTLALHELATNAVKYGALSVEEGWIEVSWEHTDLGLDLVWREHGGPPVAQPTRRGFGSLLITRNLGVAFGGKVDLTFHASGVECRLRAPASDQSSSVE